MLPPGMLEKLDLVAEWLPVRPSNGGLSARNPMGPAEVAIRDRLADGPRPVPDLEGEDGRAAALRRLRSMAAARAYCAWNGR